MLVTMEFKYIGRDKAIYDEGYALGLTRGRNVGENERLGGARVALIVLLSALIGVVLGVVLR
jgi:hypothetical protein